MATSFEVVLTSDESDQLWNICMWDITTGTTLTTYKGGISRPKTLSVIGQDYLISASKKEPIIQIWSLSKTDPFHLRMISPGVVTCLTVCPNGVYCVAGIGEKLHIWQICTGDLLGVHSYHYQPITCLKFTDDGSHFISSGEDGLVLVWDFSRILSESSVLTSSPPQPRHVWSHHSLQVTDVHIGFGGIRARVATCSLDQTCKLYELASGRLLVSIVMDNALTAVTMDAAEYHLFLGTFDGNIYQINLFSSMVDSEIHPDQNGKKNAFTGHSKQVTCLSVSLDGQTLLSGSHDYTAKLWNIQSKQCIRTLDHKGPVSNALLIRTPPDDHSKLRLPVSQFKRHLCGTEEEMTEDGNEKRSVTIYIKSHELPQIKSHSNYTDVLKSVQRDKDVERNEELIIENDKLQQINQHLYNYSINSILSSIK